MGRKTNYNIDIYEMYENECNKNNLLNKQIIKFKSEINNLKYELNYQQENQEINSTYWREKETALYNRLFKYKKNVL